TARYMALGGWAWALRCRGRSADLIRTASAAVQLGHDAGRADWEFTSSYLLGEGLIEACELDAALEAFEQASKVPTVLSGWAPVVFRGSRAIASGRLDEGAELVERTAVL